MTTLKHNGPSPHGAEAHDGYFPPDSVLRKVTGEAVVLLGGGYAILLQLAHPFVAAGVDDYSSYQSDILARLYRTVYFVNSLVCDSRENVESELRQFHAGHARIRGRLGERAGNFSPETGYSGTDPQTKLWVHATMVDSVLKAYERFIRPLTPEECESFYTDTLLLAQLVEIPETILPPTLEAFHAYMDEMVTGDTLVVTETARRLGQAVLYPDVGLLPAASASLLRVVTAELLPERFRRAYGLPWSGSRQLLLNGLSNTVRLLRPVAPAWVWQSPLRRGKLLRFMLWGSESQGARAYQVQ